LWGAYLCDYYQDRGFATPENGVALFSFARGLLGLYVYADGSLALAGQLRPPGSWGSGPWQPPSAPLPPGWPPEVAAVELRQLVVGGTAVYVRCAVESNAIRVAGASVSQDRGEKTISGSTTSTRASGTGSAPTSSLRLGCQASAEDAA
jgi:hypothetical protein